MRSNAFDSTTRSAEPALSAVGDFLTEHSGTPPASFLARLFGRHPFRAELRSAYRMACGEIAVADALTQLGSEWTVLHAVPMGRGIDDLEYVAIGPSGVFSIAVRQHPGKAVWLNEGILLVEGERMPYIREAEFEAVRASQLLSEVVGTRVDVAPCLVLVEPRSLTVAKPPRRVGVLTQRELRQWLRELPRALDQEQLAAFRHAAALQSEWRDTLNPSAEVAKRIERFRAIHHGVIQARHVRLTWVTGALVLCWLMVMVGLGGITTSLLGR